VILYCFPIAPNPTRVRLYIAEKECGGASLAIEESLVNLARGEQNSPEHLARNPSGALPVLELDDGSMLTESTAIVEFLEELFPDPPLIGRDPVERARVRELDRICDLGILMGMGRLVHATNSPLGIPPNPAVADWAQSVVDRALERLEGILADGRDFVAGSDPTIADCTLAAGLQFGRFRDLLPDARYQRVHAWSDRYRERPAAKTALDV